MLMKGKKIVNAISGGNGYRCRAACCFKLGKVGRLSFLDLRRFALPSVKQQTALSIARLRAVLDEAAATGKATGREPLPDPERRAGHEPDDQLRVPSYAAGIPDV